MYFALSRNSVSGIFCVIAFSLTGKASTAILGTTFGSGTSRESVFRSREVTVYLKCDSDGGS